VVADQTKSEIKFFIRGHLSGLRFLQITQILSLVFQYARDDSSTPVIADGLAIGEMVMHPAAAKAGHGRPVTMTGTPLSTTTSWLQSTWQASPGANPTERTPPPSLRHAA